MHDERATTSLVFVTAARNDAAPTQPPAAVPTPTPKRAVAAAAPVSLTGAIVQGPPAATASAASPQR